MAETTAQKIARLEALLQSGASSSTMDGETTQFDLTSARRELQKLRESAGITRKRTRVITPNMGRR